MVDAPCTGNNAPLCLYSDGWIIICEMRAVGSEKKRRKEIHLLFQIYSVFLQSANWTEIRPKLVKYKGARRNVRLMELWVSWRSFENSWFRDSLRRTLEIRSRRRRYDFAELLVAPEFLY